MEKKKKKFITYLKTPYCIRYTLRKHDFEVILQNLRVDPRFGNDPNLYSVHVSIVHNDHRHAAVRVRDFARSVTRTEATL